MVAPARPTFPARSPREDIRPPKFADKFAVLDFDAETMPVISMFTPPTEALLDAVDIAVRGDDLRSRTIAGSELAALPQVEVTEPLVCQIFNWYATPTWGGVRLVDVLGAAGLHPEQDGYYAVHSRDGHYFETLSRDEAIDPRVLLVTSLNGQPLPHEYGGPIRLFVPFLQGYKSVKWVGAIQAYRNDPAGIKRLLGQSKTGRLGQAWLDRLGIEVSEGEPGDPG